MTKENTISITFNENCMCFSKSQEAENSEDRELQNRKCSTLLWICIKWVNSLLDISPSAVFKCSNLK